MSAHDKYLQSPKIIRNAKASCDKIAVICHSDFSGAVTVRSCNGKTLSLPIYNNEVQSNHQLRMDVYTFPELADMVMCYGEARGNGRRALHMYQQQFQNRNHPHHTMFARLYQRLRDDGSLRPRCIGGRPRRHPFSIDDYTELKGKGSTERGADAVNDGSDLRRLTSTTQKLIPWPTNLQKKNISTLKLQTKSTYTYGVEAIVFYRKFQSFMKKQQQQQQQRERKKSCSDYIKKLT
ncbi:hypothetical protein ANN_23185 [Periplaneta americana]|uniref:DUF4817 domain-containing protein n=1 Tax=Periplaneta americana TaxID=6978 RepID=A0ABQ8SKI4_PERAM|nr:hypothetical protein ANN_23185 [Periplaneta americana]